MLIAEFDLLGSASPASPHRMHSLSDWPHLGQIVTYHFEFSHQPRGFKLGGSLLPVPLCRCRVPTVAAKQTPRDLRAAASRELRQRGAFASFQPDAPRPPPSVQAAPALDPILDVTALRSRRRPLLWRVPQPACQCFSDGKVYVPYN